MENFKNKLLVGAAALGLTMFGVNNAEAQTPGQDNKPLTGQETKKLVSEQEAMLRADLAELEAKEIKTAEDEKSIAEIKELLKPFEEAEQLPQK